MKDEASLFGGPDFSLERAAGAPGKRIAGVDEAGRGAWSGPVVAAAVVFDPACIPEGLDDSKKLSAKKRDGLFDLILASADVGIGYGSVEQIEVRNVLNATLDAMRDAILALESAPDHALIDGNKTPLLACSADAIVGVSSNGYVVSIQLNQDGKIGSIEDMRELQNNLQNWILGNPNLKNKRLNLAGFSRELEIYA